MDSFTLERNRRLLSVIMPVNTILAKMTARGVPVSFDMLRAKAREWKHRIAVAKAELFQATGEFNLDSHSQAKATLKKFGLLTESVDQQTIAQLHLEHPEHDKLFHNWRLIKLLRHRLSNFVTKFITYDLCSCGGKRACQDCGGTGIGEVTGVDDRYVSLRDGWHWLHPAFRQTTVTHRIVCDSPNVQQFPRRIRRFDITVRDIVTAPPGYVIVNADLSKADRKGAAIIFDDPAMLEEVKNGVAGFSEFAAVLGVPKASFTKDSDAYTGVKIAVYLSQYFGGAERMAQVVLATTGFPLSLSQAQEIRNAVWHKYARYYSNAQNYAWNALRHGYCVSFHGAVLKLPVYSELAGFARWQDVYKSRQRSAVQVFERLCRTVTAFVISCSMTGIGTQLALLRATDGLDQISKPGFFSVHRSQNGDWERGPRPLAPVHDSIMALARESDAEETAAVLKSCLERFDEIEPELIRNPKSTLRFDMQAETSWAREWS